MTWQPRNTVFDFRPLAPNLLAYIEEQGEDALTWANAGQDALANYALLLPNAAAQRVTVFPALLILTQDTETDLKGDVLVAAWQVVFEGVIAHSDSDELAIICKAYSRALESMLSNIPSATLCADADPASHGKLMELETTFDQLARDTATSAFIQVFNTRALFWLTQAAF